MQQGLLFIFLGRGRGSLWQIIIYVVFLIGRGLLFISYLRQKKGTYLQPEHWKTAIGDRSWMYGSHHDPKCLGMCVMILHCEGPWLTAKLKDQGGCCLFLISGKRRILTHSQSTGKRRSAIGDRRSAIEAGCKGVIMTQNVWACVS